MTFQSKQEIELIVSYTMYGYMGLVLTQKGEPVWGDVYKHHYMRFLEGAAGEGHMYVTETGKSWAGKIEKATFRINPFDFEKYLAERGVFEGIRSGTDKGMRSKKDKLLEFLKNAPMTRNWSPEYKKWKLIKDKRNRDLHLELVYEPFEPKGKEDDLKLFYIFPTIPVNAELFDRLLEWVKEYMEKEFAQREKMLQFWADAEKKKTHPGEQIRKATAYWQKIEPYSPAVERNLADAILEFYGIRRNNPEIQDFLERQYWYPAEPRTIDPGLKERLMKAGAPDSKKN